VAASADSSVCLNTGEQTPPERSRAFEVENLSVSVAGRQLLQGATVDIPARGVMALLGASGCGKTALLRALNRMNESRGDCVTEGLVRFDGQDIYQPEYDVRALRRQVGMVFREPHLMAGTVFDNVAWGLRTRLFVPKKTYAEKVEQALTRAGLWDDLKDRLKSPAQSLNPGTQQRLCVARALALSPRVLLLDEPSSALDPVASARLEETLSELRETVTIVMVTHAPQQAARVSQTAAFFDQGKLIEVGDTDDIFTRPRMRATEDYLTGRYG
jgi:phosphate transport system ATP-binding protein